MGSERSICRFPVAVAAVLAAACSGSPTSDGPADAAGATSLLSVTPAVGAVGVGLSPVIEVHFDGPIATTMRQYIALHDGDCPGPVVGGMWSRTEDQLGLDFAPFQPLEPATLYTVHVGGGMTDGSGGHFDLGAHGVGLGGIWATEEMVLGADGMGMGMDMMGQTISHTGLGWAYTDGTFGMVFQFTTGS